MTESPGGSNLIGDQMDDGQLTIRIPNPKVFMARKSLWIGRRGKPRCDHCRTNNLKCNRELPTCNHCSWTSDRECKYTPLPTPAHRGIPRCDRCRSKNLKCDRNLPICNFCTEEPGTACNYTPKKRHKVPVDKSPAPEVADSLRPKTASFLITDMSEQAGNGGDSRAHTFYGQNVASSSAMTDGASTPTTPKERDGSSEPDVPPYPQTGRFSYDNRPWPPNVQLPHIAPRPPHPANQLSFISHTFPPEQGMVTSNSKIQPWYHPAFVPLPDNILSRLVTINSVDMPIRAIFDDALTSFVAGLMPELRETAIFIPETYVALARSLSTRGSTSLSPRLRAWTSYHHICSGSDRYNLILVPTDATFEMDQEGAKKLRQEYCRQVDTQARSVDEASKKSKLDHDINEPDPSETFERLPVQNQIYDILAYAHYGHDSSFAMLSEIRRLGMASITWPMADIFVRLCPTCSLRSKHISQSAKAESSSTGSILAMEYRS